jgi:hypothetical protein
MLAEMSDSVLAVEAVVGEPVSASSGSGAKLGPFEGRVFVVGPHVVYNTLLMHRPMIFNFHNYQEFDAINRFDGNVTTLATTIKF